MEPITIIVPVKDEEEGLKYLLEDFSRSQIQNFFAVRFIFVIDIRTDDSSKEIASNLSDCIIDQRDSTGKGSAVRQAVSKWKSNPTQKVIFLDADGSYSFDSVIKILQTLEEGADVVSGSRFLSNSHRPRGMTRLHNFGNRALSLISSIRNGRKISDLCTGLWGFKEEALQNLNLTSQGFDLEAEIAGLARRNNLKHVEVGVEWSQRKGGTSKLRSLTDGLIIFFRIIRT